MTAKVTARPKNYYFDYVSPSEQKAVEKEEEALLEEDGEEA